MNIKNIIKNEINQVLEKRFNLENVDFSVEYPPAADLGDYACNVAMILAKELKKNPLEIAKIFKKEIKNNVFQKIEIVKPGFINFYLTNEFLQRNIKDILKKKDKFGSSKIGKKKKVVIDYSSPNVAKNMHVGHLRSTIIGDALAKIFEFLGYKVISDNHLGDWGTQYGILIFEYKNKYGDKIKKDLTIDDLEKMYVNYIKKEKENPKIREKARAELKKLQSGNQVNLKLWKYFCKISRGEFNKKIYQKLKIRKFDLWQGESFYNKQLKQIVKLALKKGVAKKSEGAIIVNLEKYNLPPMLIQKSDNAFLYATTDLATIDYRHKKFNPAKILYVVANQQVLHFKQLFKAAGLLKLYDKEKMEHIKFGLLLGENGKKMSTRAGGTIKATKIIDDIILKSKKIIDEKNPNLSENEKKAIAEKIGIGALKYNDLSQNRLSDIIFDWKKMLSFESGSVPYLQYTYVRIESILSKSKIRVNIKNLDLLEEVDEKILMKNLIKFPEIILESAETFKPNLIANYLESLAACFHHYYESVPILKSNKKTQSARLTLIISVAQVIKNGLNLLGIEVMKKM